MIERLLQPRLMDLATRYPVLTLTGPRQSGKTTLSRMAFPDHPYVSLENPAQRGFAEEDPLAFLARYPHGAILDEVQRVPQIFSYLQGLVDEDPRPGRFLLTGSQNLALVGAVTQSLAGRTTLTELLPLSLAEIRRFPEPPADLDTLLWQGGYPRIYERHLPAHEWLADYTATYVERDVRQLIKVGDLLLFQTFLRLCASRTGQILNLSSLANDCGVSQPTARSWLSVLEASYIVFRLPPFFANLGKRLIKAPKLYFYDAGLAASLLNLESPGQLATHPLRGALFETWVVAEVTKAHLHRGHRPRLSYYRDRSGLEIDLILEKGSDLVLVEIKSAQTPSSYPFAAFERFGAALAGEEAPRIAGRIVVYGGEESQERSHGQLLSWRDLDRYDWEAGGGGGG
ncbi:MAG TPA: ATP-binding protein [Thermoanaerobaculia bacterium]|nr:ATP-binding protein [Thermoanaerobaculia bacterium]